MRRLSFADLVHKSTLVICCAILGAVVTWSIGCGGGSISGGTTDTLGATSYQLGGRAVAPASIFASPGVSLRTVIRRDDAEAASEPVPLGNAEVWFEANPDLRTRTDAQGAFSFVDVPPNEHRIVGKFADFSFSRTLRGRSNAIQAPVGFDRWNVGDVLLDVGVKYVQGVIKNVDGLPIPGSKIITWGETVRSDDDGKFRTPSLPRTAEEVELIVEGSSEYEKARVRTRFISDLPTTVEITLIRAGTNANHWPYAMLKTESNQVQPGEAITVEATLIDDDPADMPRLTGRWAITDGRLASTTDPLKVRWIAPAIDGLATVAITVTDPAGASASTYLPIQIGSGFYRDQAPPALAGLVPGSGAVAIAINTPVQLTFNEPVIAQSVAAAFQLIDETGIVQACQLDNLPADNARTITLRPVPALSPLARYRAILRGGPTGVSDVAGNRMTTDHNWEFTTAPGADSIGPQIIGMVPANGETNVSSATRITLRFSETMATATLDSSVVAVTAGGVAVGGTLSFSADGTVATFTPTTPFGPGSVVSVRVTQDCRDLARNPLQAVFAAGFQIRNPALGTPAVIISTVPPTGTIGAATNTAIAARFDRPINASSLAAGTTFRVASGPHSLSGTVAVSDDRLVASWSPTAPLPAGATIGCIITADVTDATGVPLGREWSWSFTTATAPETTPPSIVSANPASGSAGVATGGTLIAIGFSEPLDPTSVASNSVVVASGGMSLPGTLSVSPDGLTVNWIPAQGLPPSAVIVVTVTSAVSDRAGNRMTLPLQWSFMTISQADQTRPQVLAFTPPDTATGVAASSPITIRFSEPMNGWTVSPSTVTVTSGSTAIAGFVSLSPDGQLATFVPAQPWPWSSQLIVRLASSASDLAWNSIGSDTTWTFRVTDEPDLVAPTIVAFSPANGATAVATGTAVTVQFSESMAASTLGPGAIRLSSGSTAIIGNISIGAGNRVATFTPSSPLPYWASITVTVAGDVADPAGNRLGSDRFWTFGTPAEPDATAPVLLARSPAAGAIGVVADTAITVTFSEPMATHTIDATSFTLASGATPITGLISFSANRILATFTPSARIPQGSVLTARLAASCADLASNTLGADQTWTFSTVAPLRLLAMVPASGATAVSATAPLSLIFDRPVSPSSIGSGALELATASGTTTGWQSVTLSGDGLVATFVPARYLFPPGWVATVTLAVRGTDGSYLDTPVCQTFSTKHWTRQFGTATADYVRGLARNSSGRLFVAGLTNASMDGQPYAGGTDLFVSAWDEANHILTRAWTWEDGSAAGEDLAGGSVAFDGAGNVYVAGNTSGALPGYANLGSSDWYLEKLAPGGTLTWRRQFGTAGQEWMGEMRADAAGNLFFSATTPNAYGGHPSRGNRDTYFMKYDTTGTQIWVQQFANNLSDIANGAAIDGSGNAYTLVETAGTIGTGTSGGWDICLGKMDNAGNKLWTRQFGSTIDDNSRVVVVDGNGNVYSSGITSGNWVISFGSWDFWVMKHDSNGNEVWRQQFGSNGYDESQVMLVDQDGNLIISGYVGGSLLGMPSAGSNDCFVMKLDPSGNRIWARQFGTAGSDQATGLAIGPNNDIYIAGQCTGAIDGNTDNGSSDGFLAKFDTNGNRY